MTAQQAKLIAAIAKIQIASDCAVRAGEPLAAATARQRTDANASAGITTSKTSTYSHGPINAGRNSAARARIVPACPRKLWPAPTEGRYQTAILPASGRPFMVGGRLPGG